MCEINPKRKHFFRLEFYTNDKRITDEQWNELVLEKLVQLEQAFNRTGRIRVHIHEAE